MNDQNNRADCGCDGNCCPPKKKSIWPKVLFAAVMVAALGIILAKVFLGTGVARQASSEPTQVTAGCADSTGKSGCDSTKSSSCCGN